MQIYHTGTRGLVDSFTIKSHGDNHNNIDLDFKWRIVIFDNYKSAQAFATKIDKSVTKLKKFSAVTIPCNVFTFVNNFRVFHPNVYGYIVCIDDTLDDEVVAHECYHASYLTFARSVDKVKIDDYDQQEVLAYLTGQFVKSFNDEYRNRKHRARFFRPKPNTKGKNGVQRASKKPSKRGK